jgi:VIT1/CCC1 family predicted Fe2+/Mn2+ transporter
MERVSEILFGLIMVLTVTCSFSVARAGQKEIRDLLVGALGCNLAWGIIDAVFYLMSRLSEQGQALVALRALRATDDPAEAQQIIGDALPPLLASVLPQAEYEVMRQKLNELPELPTHPWLAKDDWVAAGRIFLLVFLSTFPVTIPFLFVHQAVLALRISNVVANAMLFGCGYAFGRFSGFHPWRAGVAMVLVGILLVGLTIALGG